MKSKNGFTLIELLAVITIMGILMIVAIPAITKVIQNAREDVAVNSVKTFVNEANREIISTNTAGYEIEDGKYKVTSEGNICLDESISSADDCSDSDLLIVDIDGQKVNGGEVEIKDNKVVSVSNMEISNKYVNVDESGDYYVSSTPVVTVQTLCKSVNGILSYDLGTAYNCKVNDSTTYTFYVLSVEGDKVSLIMNSNLGGAVAWHDGGTGVNYNACGPTTAYTTLHSLTSSWSNVSNVTIDYVDPNDSSIKVYTYNGAVNIMSKDPDCTDFEVYLENLKARLPYMRELNDSYSWLFVNLAGSGGVSDYWANETVAGTTYAASTAKTGFEVLGAGAVGLRPVIEVTKGDLS